MNNSQKYRVVGGSMSGKQVVPDAPGMQQHPDTRPISPADQSPLAQAARAEAAQSGDAEYEPETFSFAEGEISFYRPKGMSRRDALRQLGFTDNAAQNMTYDQLELALEEFKPN